MKTLVFGLSFLFFISAKAQNFVLSSMEQPKCFNACDGTAIFTSTTATGPFTAVMANSSSCPNSTVQSSSGNTITLSNICACATDYTVSFYNSSMVLVGYEFLQVPITSTAPLVVTTPTIVPAVCPTCCEGKVYIEWTGGYIPSPNTPTVLIDGNNVGLATFPNASVCVGSHTVCVEDLAGCVACTTFSMGYSINVGVDETDYTNSVMVYPNPTNGKITVEMKKNSGVTSIEILDIHGRSLLNAPVNSDEDSLQLDMSFFNNGVYICQLHTNSGILRRTRIIKTN